MSIKSTILIDNYSTETWDGISDTAYSYSEKQKGAGFHGKSDGIHTALFQLSEFVGDIKLQGTLERYPNNNDWVDIVFDGQGIISFVDSTMATSNETRNFLGNFVWLRAAFRLVNGTIVQIRYNH
jgi:hypothetical protein